MDNDSFVSTVNKRDTLLVLLFAIVIGVLNELTSYFFIYRKESFRKGFEELCDAYEVYVLSKVIPKTKSQIQSGDTPAKILLDKTKKLKNNKTISSIITGILLMGLMPAIMSMFEYSVVAKLPFKPIPLISMFTHSKVLGNDPTDCTATSLYAIVSMIARHYTKVFLGCESPLNPFNESVLNEQVKKESKL
ncbi:hypothetical protein MACJ_002112 [Theileria orientalis]|uniref:CLAC channel n=1 Tax=Theileria orientalis TaxID=68886 RepID=A0A976QS37_THEOR|nr:hypothetical protein MACJ_002112 [Theileria orientalis]